MSNHNTYTDILTNNRTINRKMSKTVLIGSSNIYRPWDKDMKDVEKRDINLKRCMKIEVFIALMNELTSDDKRILISVIENFVCDAVLSEEKNEVEKKVNETLSKFFETIKATAVRLPETRFVRHFNKI